MGTPDRERGRKPGDRGVGVASTRTTPRLLAGHIRQLEISQGAGAGEPFELLAWERRFLRVFGRPGDAALTIARGNGKTTLVAAIADAALRGPLRQRRAEVVCVASSFAQGRIIFDHVLEFGRYKADPTRWRVHDTSQRASIECRQTGARVRCIGSDPRRMHGIAPLLILADEPAQWEPAKADRAYAALRTSLGKIPGSRLIGLGTRPAEAGHWFARMLRTAPNVQIHAARPGDPPFQRRTWKRANPSLDFMPHLEARIREEAAAAKRDPSLLAQFVALRLNGGTADHLQQTLLDAGTWERIEVVEGRHSGPFVLGVDLGQSAAMSAAAGYWPETGCLEALACFPETPTLAERGLADGVGRRYLDMHSRGELILAGGRVSDVGALLAEARARWGDPAVIVADRWREAELRQTLEAVRFPLAHLVVRGMGFRDGGEDVRRFRAACLGGEVAPVRSLLVRSAVGEARVIVDAAGNAKLSKGTQGGRRLTARDDAAAAAILAVAEGVRRDRAGGPQRAESVVIG